MIYIFHTNLIYQILIIMFTVTEVVYSAGALAGESSADGHIATDSTFILIDSIINDVIHGIVLWYSALYHG